MMMEVMRPLVPFDPWLTETVRMLKGAWTFDPENCDETWNLKELIDPLFSSVHMTTSCSEKKHAHALRKVMEV